MTTTLHAAPPQQSTLSLLVVEDDDLLRSLLVATLNSQPRFRVLEELADGRDVLAAVERHRPDVVLLDLHLPGQSGLSVLKSLSRSEGGPAVLVFSGDEDAETQLEAARHGARGYLPKSRGAQCLTKAIETVARHELYFAPEIRGRIYHEFVVVTGRAREEQKPLNKLTERERDVLIGVARGLTNKQIGSELFMSVHTVKLHVQNILKKLQLPNRTEAAVLAVREGLLDNVVTQDLLA